jgi:OPT oligopeptide transporter protein
MAQAARDKNVQHLVLLASFPLKSSHPPAKLSSPVLHRLLSSGASPMATDSVPSQGAITDAPPEGHQSYVPDSARLPEFTWSAVLVGAVLGIVFGASSLYLVLKVGMTVSASIPVAVLSITLFRWAARTFGIRPATILENNIVQTTGSAGESIAFGVGVTMPAMMLIACRFLPWRPARHFDDDSAAAGIHCQTSR